MKVSFNGFEEAMLTMEANGALTAGMPVMMSANGKAAACTANTAPVGIVRDVRGGFASVQLKGYVTVAYTGTVALGWQTLAGDGAGAVKAADTGRGMLVLDVDTAAKTCGIIL